MFRFTSQLTSASEHLISYLEHSDKQVVGTTYKDIHRLVDQVAESGFFDTVGHVSAEATTDAAVTEPALDEAYQPTESEPAPAESGMAAVSVACHLMVADGNSASC